MSMLLFHSVRLASPAFGSADSLLALCALIALAARPTVRRSQALLRDDRSAIDGGHVYRQLWDRLEEIYWELRERHDSTTVRRRLRLTSAYFVTNDRLIKPRDRRLIRLYILLLNCLNTRDHRPDEDGTLAIWEDYEPAPPSSLRCRVLANNVDLLRNLLMQQVQEARCAN